MVRNMEERYPMVGWKTHDIPLNALDIRISTL